MKKLLILCLLVVATACKEEPKIDYALINGKIENPKGDKVAILEGRTLIKEITLEEDGTFTDTLNIDKGFYRLSHGNEMANLYLNQGDDLKVTLNTKEFDETITFTGQGSENNNYIASKVLAEEQAGTDYAKIFAMDEADFMSEIEKIKTSDTAFLTKNTSIDSGFRALQEKNIQYDYLLNIQNYESYHSYYAKKPDFKTSDNFKKTLESIDYTNQEDYKTVESYKRLVQTHYVKAISKSDNPSIIFETVNNETFPELKKDLTQTIAYEINPNNAHNDAYYNGLMAMSTDEKFKNGLTTKYNTVKKLAKGMPSPAFVDYENHKGGTTSLEDLKGKYVYVDVWATWCGPCKREIPYLKTIEKEFHGKNIAFVSTSIDRAKDHNAWVKMVTDKELGGIQLFADNDWQSKFVTDYAIEGIPRFLLIDPDGNIVTADAPRPSNPELKDLFKELSI